MEDLLEKMGEIPSEDEAEEEGGLAPEKKVAILSSGREDWAGEKNLVALPPVRDDLEGDGIGQEGMEEVEVPSEEEGRTAILPKQPQCFLGTFVGLQDSFETAPL